MVDINRLLTILRRDTQPALTDVLKLLALPTGVMGACEWSADLIIIVRNMPCLRSQSQSKLRQSMNGNEFKTIWSTEYLFVRTFSHEKMKNALNGERRVTAFTKALKHASDRL